MQPVISHLHQMFTPNNDYFVFSSVHELLANLGLTLYQCTVVFSSCSFTHSNAFECILSFLCTCMYVYTYVLHINIPFGCFLGMVIVKENAYCMCCKYL